MDINFEEETIKEINKIIDEATDFRVSQRDKEYISNEAQYEGLGWNLASYNKESPFMMKSDINHLKNAVDIRLGSLFANTYYGELKPQSPYDIEAIQELNVAYKNEWFRLNMDSLIEKAIKAGAICDNGYIEFNVDANKIYGGTNTKREGLITANFLDPSAVYLDPSADCIENCDYMVVKSRKTRNWIKRNKPEWVEKLKEKQIKSGSITGSENGQIYTGRDYDKGSANIYELNTVYRKERIEEEIPLTDNEGNPILDKEGNPKVDKKVSTAVRIYYVIARELLEKNDKYPFDEIPIIPFQWDPIPQSPYGIPLLRGLVVPQRVANLIESAINNIAMLNAIPTYLVSTESGIDIDEFAKLSQAPGIIWEVNGDVAKAVKRLNDAEVNEAMVAIKESFVGNIKEYAGVNSPYQGNVGTAGSTSSGTMEAINRATIIDNNPLKQIEVFVEKLSRMLVKFMTRYYKGEHIYIRDTEKDINKLSDRDFTEIEMKEEFSALNYDFTVDLASRNKNDKNRQFNLMKELYQLQNQYKDPTKVINITDVVKAANLDNYNEMFKRFSDMSEEAYNEKANLIVQLMQIGQTMTPNGTPLISAEQLQEGIIDVLDDNGDLSTASGIIQTYEEYQTAIAELQNQAYNNEQDMMIANLQNNVANQQ